jgi:hypothetical protein
VLNYGGVRIVGSSFFIVCARDYYDECVQYEETVDIAKVYLIDMCHLEQYSDNKKRDQGFLKGTLGVIKILNEIIIENNDLTEINK